MKVEKFIDENLREYSSHSNIRAIPFIGDGFKQVQRKAVYYMVKRGKQQQPDTVERIAGHAASSTDYKHGAGSMEDAIVKMAQSFPGSNNIPLFESYGQFGNIVCHDSSASRYIKTRLAQSYRALFREEDEIIYVPRISNGVSIEPKYLIPIIPIVLLNGAEGLGTGHSTYIMSYKLDDLKELILNLLDKKKIIPNTILPFWNGFKGTVERAGNGQLTITGCYEITDLKRNKKQIRITELPINGQALIYKKFLATLEDSGIIDDFDDYSDDSSFDFRIVVNDQFNITHENILKTFKLVSKETENFTVWNRKGYLQRFGSAEELLYDFVLWRLERYQERKNALISKYKKDIEWANEKIRFIRYYLGNHLMFRDTPNKELIKTLVIEKFSRHDELLSMPMRNLTHDKIKELENEVEKLQKLLIDTESDTPKKMYSRELKAIKL